MVDRLDRQEIEQVLAPAAPQAVSARRRASAVDYIADVLGRGATREQLKERTLPRPLPPRAAPARLKHDAGCATTGVGARRAAAARPGGGAAQ